MLRYTIHALRRMKERNLPEHLAEVVVAMGKKEHVNHRIVRFSWNSFTVVVDTRDWQVITAYDGKLEEVVREV